MRLASNCAFSAICRVVRSNPVVGDRSNEVQFGSTRYVYVSPPMTQEKPALAWRLGAGSLRHKLTVVLLLMSAFVGSFSLFILFLAEVERKHAALNRSRNHTAESINLATAVQASEREVGNIVIGGDRTLLEKFEALGRRGDAHVAAMMLEIATLQAKGKGSDYLTNAVNRWQRGFQRMKESRARISAGTIGSAEWSAVATENILNEFTLQDLLFHPSNADEAFIYLSTTLRPNIAYLAEFAGRERALIGNALASGAPLRPAHLLDLDRYRSRVDEAVQRIKLLKNISAVGPKLKDAIRNFEETFLGRYDLLRREIYALSSANALAMSEVRLELNNASSQIEEFLRGIKDDITILVGNRHFKDLAYRVAKGEAPESQRTAHLFEDLAVLRQRFDQVRYLDANGTEVLRVNFRQGVARPVTTERLQAKGGRYYFVESKDLPRGQIYVSPLDLNVERGEIERPFRPVVRYAVSVWVEGQRHGVAVLNLKAQPFLRDLPAGFLLVDENGFYLHHPDPSKEWGMMTALTRGRHTLGNDIPEVKDALRAGKPGTKLVGDTAYLYTPVSYHPDDPSRFWMIFNAQPITPYPISRQAWVDQATEAIDSAVAVSSVLSEQANTAIQRKELRANLFLGGAVLLAVVVVLVLYLGVGWFFTAGRKLRRIGKGMETLAAGDFGSRIAIGRGPLKPDGGEKPGDEFEMIAAGVDNMAENIGQMMETLRDNETRLRHSQKMQAVGLVTSGVAHHFNNLLQIVVGNLELLRAAVEGNEEATRQIELAVSASQRGSEITQQLLAFSHSRSLWPEVLDVNAMIHQQLPLLRQMLGEQVRIESDLAEQLPKILIDRSALEGILQSLVLNARAAMPDGGVLKLSTCTQSKPDAPPSRTTSRWLGSSSV